MKINAGYTKYSYLIIKSPYIEAQPLNNFRPSCRQAGTLIAIKINVMVHTTIQSFMRNSIKCHRVKQFLE
jgi:hypothetical protein